MAWVTGGTSGIGLAIAAQLAWEGVAVALQGRDQAKAEAAASWLREEISHRRTQADTAHRTGAQVSPKSTDDGRDIEVMTVCADVRDADAMHKAATDVANRWGALDHVVAAAAGNFFAPMAQLSPNGFKAVVEIDLLGSFHAAKAAFPHLRVPGASLLFISAPQAVHAMVGQAHVCAAKAGVDMLMRTLALEWGPLGIRVNGLIPGPIDGTEGMRRLAPTPAIRAHLERGVPMQRFGRLDEIAAVAAFMLSAEASYMHGALVPCDGGQSLQTMSMAKMAEAIDP